MGNCCKSFPREEESEANPMESLPTTHSEGNPSDRISRFTKDPQGNENPREILSRSNDGNPREMLTNANLCARCRTSLNREEECRVNDQSDNNNNGRHLLIDKQASSSLPTHARNFENERERTEYVFRGRHPGLGRIPNASQAELIAAGWPLWLARDAGKAIMGWVPRKEESFQIMDQIGEGTYSYVYRAIDLKEKKVVALKKVKLYDKKPGTIRFMAREIDILRRLDHPNIIKLESIIASEMSAGNFYLVFEYMEHDLAGLASHPGLKFTEPQAKCYLKQLLCGLDYCHRLGILHRDIKGSNLLVDDNGILKIADFGLANFYNPHQAHPLTNRVVTLWYRPPELLLGATCYGRAVDLWSVGCILAELYAGKPIFPGSTEVEQLHRIFTLCGSPSEDYWNKLQLPRADIFNTQKPFRRVVAETFKHFPAPAVALMETLLSLDPSARQSATHALNSEFFSSEPLPCQPADLPKYPLRKQKDAGNANQDRKYRYKDPVLFEYGSLRRNVQNSRRRPDPVRKPDQLLSDQHDYGQEAVRRALVNKGKQKRVQGEAVPLPLPLPANALFIGKRAADQLKKGSQQQKSVVKFVN